LGVSTQAVRQSHARKVILCVDCHADFLHCSAQHDYPLFWKCQGFSRPESSDQSFRELGLPRGEHLVAIAGPDQRRKPA
ncbi:hypothetical protein AB0L13_47580, partial [Saccharopolyspora shandongensis]|uniref:hypothetical protein n=1 Tax=Saccharopolyspora shandongensis TaxID=418495 RepID=UPI003447CBF8